MHLWVVDNTATMGTHRQNIANQIGSFVDTFLQKQMDFNMAITTMDMRFSKGAEGSLIGAPKVLSSASASVKDQFKANMNMPSSDSTQEQGLAAMKAALSPDLLTSLNKGFLRTDAVLVVIFMTDENDHSSGDSASYVTFLNNLKPNFKYGARGWVANTIGVIDSDGACKTGSQSPEVAERYLSLTKTSGGVAQDICASDLSSALKNIQTRIAQMVTEYQLDREPIESTIVVTVDGVVLKNDLNNGWTYLADGMLIVFHGTGIPKANSSVRVDYQPQHAKQ